MFNIILFEPEIPPNTGNIIRLCANIGAKLHLIKPLGFELDDKKLRRAGLDYHEWADVKQYDDYQQFLDQFKPRRIFACSTKGQTSYNKIDYQANDGFIFGPESRGLPNWLLEHNSVTEIIRIPMLANSRSLNLSNSCSVIVYEAWRQNEFISNSNSR